MTQMPLQLLGIVVLAAAFVLIAGSSALLLLSGGAVLLTTAMVLVARASLRTGAPGPSPGPKPIDEGADERVMRIGAYGATLLVAGVAVTVASASDVAALGLLLIAGAWILVWWPASLRTLSTSTTMDIRRDPAAVFAFFSDQRNVPHYYYMFEQTVDKIGDAPIGAGTEFSCHIVVRAGQLPNVKQDQSFDAIERIVAFEPDRRLAITTSSGLAPNIGTYTMEPIPGGTRMTYRYDHVLSFSRCVLGSAIWGGPGATRIVTANRLDAWARAKELLESDRA